MNENEIKKIIQMTELFNDVCDYSIEDEANISFITKIKDMDLNCQQQIFRNVYECNDFDKAEDFFLKVFGVDKEYINKATEECDYMGIE